MSSRAPLKDATLELHVSDMLRSLRQQLQRVRRRTRWQRMIFGGAVGLLCGALLGVAAGLTRLQGVMPPPLPQFLLLLVATAAVGMLSAGMIPISWQDTASLVDRRNRLKGRVGTALQSLTRSDALGPWQELQIADALEHLRPLRPRDVVPLSVPATLRWATGLSAVALLTNLLPLRAQVAEPEYGPAATEVAAAGEAVEEQVAAIRKAADDLQLTQLSDLAEQLHRDMNELRSSGDDIRKAMASVSRMQADVERQQTQFSPAITDSQFRALAEALAAAKPFESAAEQLRDGNLAQAAEELEKIDPLDVTPPESDSLAESLRKLAEELQRQNPQGAGKTMSSLSSHLREQNQTGAKQDLSELAQSLRRHERIRDAVEMLEQQQRSLSSVKSSLSQSAQDAAGRAGADDQQPGGTDSANGNTPGTGAGQNAMDPQTTLEGQLQLVRLAGQLGKSGESEMETSRLPEQQEARRRAVDEVLDQYEKSSQAVLESELVPRETRETIRRYFQLIRPDLSENSDGR